MKKKKKKRKKKVIICFLNPIYLIQVYVISLLKIINKNYFSTIFKYFKLLKINYTISISKNFLLNNNYTILNVSYLL